jgi:hypothetical protein
MQPPRIHFKPVQLKARHDGWTSARQIRFIEELSASRCIARACKAVRMSRESAYKLRDRPEAASFRLAWRAALRPIFDEPPANAFRPELSQPSQPTSSSLSTLRIYIEQRRRQQALARHRTREG